MIEADLILYNTSQVHTCASQGKPKKGKSMSDTGAIEQGAIAIKEGVILEVAPQSEIQKRYGSSKKLDVGGMAVCPGFIDPHTHIVFAGNRINEFEQRVSGSTYLEIMAAGGGIMSTARAVREASVQDLVEQSLPRLQKMTEYGMTTIEIKTGYGLDLPSEMKMLQAIEQLAGLSPVTILPTFLGAHAFPTELKAEPETYVNLVVMEMLPQAMEWFKGSSFFQKGLPFFCDVFCEQNAFTLEQSTRILTEAKKNGYKIKIHSDEFTSLGGIGLGIDLGATSVDHLDVATVDDQKRLSMSETVGVLLPGVNFNLGSTHFADGRGMIDRGCAIALSTDINPGSCPSPSIPLMMAIASRYQKLTPAEALNACTINAAFAVGVGKMCGSLEKGKLADLVVLNQPDHRYLSYEFGSNPVKYVLKKGNLI